MRGRHSFGHGFDLQDRYLSGHTMAGQVLVSRPQDDLCHFYLGFCDNFLDLRGVS